VRGRGSFGVAWSLALLSFALVLAGAVLHLLNRPVSTGSITGWWLTNAVAAIGFGLPGALVAARRPRSPIGWVLLAVSLGHALTIAGREYAVHALVHGGPAAAWAVWVGTWSWLDIGLLAIVFALFPDGRLPSRRWIPLPVVVVLAELLVAGGNAVYPGAMFSGPPFQTLDNPVGWGWAGRQLDAVGYALPAWLLIGAAFAAAASMLVRLRGGTAAVRRQVLLVAPPALAFAGELAYEVNGSDRIGAIAAPVVVLCLASAIGAAILRYGLYDLDLVVSRTLVYALLTAILGGAYLGAVAGLEEVAGHQLLDSLAAAAVVAVLFAPLRTRLQGAADRLLYGERRDPYAVIASLGESLSVPAADVLPALAETVAHTLKLPFVGVELERGGAFEPAVELGLLRGEPLVLPLSFQGATIGRLTLGRRTPNDPFTTPERRLFGDIARQVAVAAHAVRLNADLQRSREHLVTAREEERRRLRRDLHDGLGPTLAGIQLQVGSARTLLGRDPAEADRLLARLVDETRHAIADVRNLVYDLRPPALDELGLVGALRQQASRFPGLDIAVEAPDHVDELPAAVEVAAYRIATEAVTNAARHAGARCCTVRISLNGALELEVSDDGTGMGENWTPGVGVTSIRERAAELGGTCTVGSAGGGTVVRARLPLNVA
jgi:signal transduction histidine kinase